MKKLMTLEEYRQTCFDEKSCPHIRTLRRRCEKKEIPGAIKQGRFWYVEITPAFAPPQVQKPKYSDDPDIEDVFRALMS